MAALAHPGVENFSFNGEAIGAAGAGALRKVRSLAESAPPGRLFAAIATLADASAEAVGAFENAANAEDPTLHLRKGTARAHVLNQALGTEPAAYRPAFLRRS